MAFFGEGKRYLYIGITSFCLYNSPGIPIFQDGIFSKSVPCLSYNAQIRKVSLTFH